MSKGQAAKHEPSHREINHGFTARSESFVVATQPAIAPEPSKGSFHNPAPWQDFESTHIVRAFDNFKQATHVPFDPTDQLSSVATIGPDEPKSFVDPRETIQQLARAITVLHVGGQHHHHQHQPHRIDQEVSLTSVNLLAGVITALAPGLTAFNGLTVENGCRRLSLFASFESDLFA